jgi:hypothetical protein
MEKSIYLYTTVYVFWASPRPHTQFFLPTSFYVNLVTKGAQKLFNALALQFTVLGIPHFLLMHIIAHCAP